MPRKKSAPRKSRAKKADAGDFFFDDAAADRAVKFFESFLRHTKGELRGKPFRLLPWQRDEVIRPLFGWKKKITVTDFDGAQSERIVRRYRTAFIEIPKKNGKTTLSAGIALYMTCADGEGGAEVYCCAADKDQARILFNTAIDMVKLEPKLTTALTPYLNQIIHEKSGSRFYVLSASPDTKHGFNPSCIIFDELHAQPDRELWDTMTMGVGARAQPLVVAITTAGYDRHSICFQQYEYAKRVLSGAVKDDSFFAFIAESQEADDWTSPDVWRKANPSVGASFQISFLEEECRKAQEMPSYENSFRRLFLNQWTKQDVRWIPMDKWAACGGAIHWPDYKGLACYGGLDLASTQDLAAFVLSFPIGDTDECALMAKFWIPREGLIVRVRRDKVPYDVWAEQGWLTITDGNVTDYSIIEKDIKALGEIYQIREIAFDRWNATQITTNLGTHGFNMIQFGQSIGWLTAPSKEFEKRIVGGKIKHGDNPVLTWNVDNVTAVKDANDNIRPDKKRSREKIDGVVASIMAIDRDMRNRSAQAPVVAYQETGIFFL